MPIYTDQLNREVEVSASPQRIISLVPSQTELLADLGLEGEVVGITKFCVHPKEWFKSKTRIGGTKNCNFDKIRILKPDLIIANKEENDQAQVEALAKEFPVWISDVKHLEDARLMISELGKITETAEKANSILLQILQNFAKISALPNQMRTAYLVWDNPIMIAGRDTFINTLMEFCGFQNIDSNTDGRYPQMGLVELKAFDPKVILLPSEPYPFKQKDLEAFHAYFPKAKVCLVDGEMFSWYGSRLIQAPAYFQKLIDSLALN